MTFLKTILAAALVCTLMLAVAVHLAGDLSEPAPTGLTAADILASDGTPPSEAGRPGARLDRRMLSRLAAEASRAKLAVGPANGTHG